MANLANYIKKVKFFSDKYEINQISEEISKLAGSKDINVSVAFLGEFSSGKSTLINALLGRKLLPAMAKPTTKNIIKVIPKKDIDTLKFYVETEDGIQEIEPVEFREYALGEKKGNTIIEVPVSELLQEGFIFIDTPGISSLDKTDTDITFGYLPFIDGAVICQDINFGGFTGSVIKFLKENLPEELKDKFIFALTKADTKPKNEVEKIKESAVATLKEEIGYQDAEKRVAACSPLRFLDTGEETALSEFKQALKEIIVDRKAELNKHRKKKILIELTSNLVESLKNIKESSSLNLDDINQKIKLSEERIYKLKKQKEQLRDKLILLTDKLTNKYERILISKIPALKELSSQEEASQILEQTSKELQAVTERSIERFLKTNFSENITIPELQSEIERSISQILAISDTIKTILRMLLMVALPGGGEIDFIQAGLGYLLSEAVDSNKENEQKKSKDKTKSSDKTESKGKKALGIIGSIVQKLDVPGKLVDFGAKHLIENKLKGKFPQIARDLALNITEELEEILEEKFQDIDDELKRQVEELNKLKKEKNKKEEEFRNFLKELDSDISNLKSLMEEIDAV